MYIVPFRCGLAAIRRRTAAHLRSVGYHERGITMHEKVVSITFAFVLFSLGVEAQTITRVTVEVDSRKSSGNCVQSGTRDFIINGGSFSMAFNRERNSVFIGTIQNSRIDGRMSAGRDYGSLTGEVAQDGSVSGEINNSGGSSNCFYKLTPTK